ncbi:hypothetical protein L208DRAFT_1476117 [Tricholoma matsutake]|nr:hypothetical protein L208DRAFT_1476117 [Tricholoma matsutake 945]
MDTEWNPLTDFFSAGLPHLLDSHALSSSYSTFSVNRSAFESQDQPGTAALNLELEHPQDGVPNELNYFGIWHLSASCPLPHELCIYAPTLPSESLKVTINPSLLEIQSPANVDPHLALRSEEEGEEEKEEEEEEGEEGELLPEGGGSVNIAIMKIEVSGRVTVTTPETVKETERKTDRGAGSPVPRQVVIL